MPAATDRPGVPFVLAVVLCAIGMRPDPGSAAAPYLCGTRLIERHAGELPLPDPPLQAAKPSSGADAGQDPPAIGVGTRQEFAVAGSPQLMPATCRYAGERVFVFVEDRQWDTNGGSILQSHVDGVGDLFERATPADPGRGIHDLCTEAFGVVPDVDGYPEVFLLVLDIADPRLVGFFDARVAGHEVPELRRDILYVDEWFVRRQTYLARGTLAHEFQHLIHWGHDRDEEIWLNEGMSGYAEALTGFPEADSTVVGAFLQRPGACLTRWESQAWNYGSTYLFSAFLAERYGGDLIRAVVADTANGTDGIDAAFAGLGLNGDFEEAWSRWVTGNFAAEGDEFTYGALQGRRALWYPVSLPLESRRGSVEDQWGTIAILLRTPGSLQVEFAGEEGGRHRVWAWSMRARGSELRELELDASNRGSAVATEIDSMALIIGRTSVEKGDSRSRRATSTQRLRSSSRSPRSARFSGSAPGIPIPSTPRCASPFRGCRRAGGLLVQRRGPAPRGADAAVRLARDSLGRPRQPRTAGGERSLLDRRAAEVGNGRPRHLACAPHRGDAHQIERGPACEVPAASVRGGGSLPAGRTRNSRTCRGSRRAVPRSRDARARVPAPAWA